MCEPWLTSTSSHILLIAIMLVFTVHFWFANRQQARGYKTLEGVVCLSDMGLFDGYS
jgi:hypothetical protein